MTERQFIPYGPRKTGNADAVPRLKLYDFKRPDKFSKEQIRTVAIIHETCARLATTYLSAELRCAVRLQVHSVDQLTFGEFQESVSEPAVYSILALDPLKGSAILEIDRSVCFPMIERLFGGKAAKSELSRDPSDVELPVIGSLVDGLLGSLREGWSQVFEMHPRLSSIEVCSQFAQIVPPREMIILVTFQVKIGAAEGCLNLCIPYLTIEPIIPRLSSRYWFSDGRHDGSSPATDVSDLPIDAELYYETVPLSIADLAAVLEGKSVELPGYAEGRAYLDAGGLRVLEFERKDGGLFAVPEKIRYDTAGDRARFFGETAPGPNGSAFDEFASRMQTFTHGMEALVKRLEAGLEELSENVLERETTGRRPAAMDAGPFGPGGFSAFDPADAENLLLVLKGTHPQLVAFIVSRLESKTAAAFLALLDGGALRTDIIFRIAVMDRVNPKYAKLMERCLEKAYSGFDVATGEETGGCERAVEILSVCSRSVEAEVIDTLDTIDPRLSEELKKRMFVFEDLVLLEPCSIRDLFSRVSREDFILALKKTDASVVSHILGALDPADRNETETCIAGTGAVRLSEVEKAQMRIIEALKLMEEEGSVVIARPGDLVP